MKLTDFQTKFVWGIGILIILLIWMIFPLIFKQLLSVYKLPADFNQFGPFGDIYGSLNTLFTSATLLIVLYSAYLQRQANKDVREAMADQLQHAKDSTAEQLRQARDATAKQLLQARQALKQQLDQARDATDQQISNAKELAHIQLEQARESTARQIEQAERAATDQLALAKETHEAQILESRHAILSNTFNIFLSQKKTVLESIAQGNSKYKPREIFNILGQKFNEFLKKESEAASKSIDETRDFLFIQMKSLLEDTGIQKVFSFNELVSYFYINISLLNLIKYSSLTKSEKEIYYKLLSHSMTHEEQLTFLWFLFFSEDLKVALTDTYVIDSYFSPDEMDFIVKHFEETYFFDPEIRATWNEYLNDKVTETPA